MGTTLPRYYSLHSPWLHSSHFLFLYLPLMLKYNIAMAHTRDLASESLNIAVSTHPDV